nr:Uncharacterised protein [Actinomyces israelii]
MTARPCTGKPAPKHQQAEQHPQSTPDTPSPTPTVDGH